MKISKFAAEAAKRLKCDEAEITKVIRETIAWATHATCDARIAAEFEFKLDSGKHETDKEIGGVKLEPAEVRQEDLSDATGVSRPYISSIVGEWEKKGIVRTVGRTVFILKPEALTEISEEIKGDTRRGVPRETKAPAKAKAPAKKAAKKKAKK